MKGVKVFDVYMEDGTNIYKTTVPAESKKAAERYIESEYGAEIVATKDSPLQDIDINYLSETLSRNGWGKMEIEVITRTLVLAGLERTELV